MRRQRGVRTRLLIVVTVSVAAALAVMTLGFNLLLAQSLARDADSLLRSRAAAEAATVDIVNDRVVAPDQPDRGGLESQAWVFRNGRALEGPRVGAALDQAARSAASTPGVGIDVPHLDTRLYATPASDDPTTVVVAGISLAPYRATQRIALVASLALAMALFLLVALASRWMLRAALQPVARMTAEAEAWSEHEPDQRFAAGEPYDELSQLAATLDVLLDRLAASLRREQRFSAEMSHELRTPLAKVRTEAELALRRERQPEEYRRALATVLRNTEQMSTAIEVLVSAAQQENVLARGRSHADAVLHDVAETCSALAAERGVELSVATLPTPLDLGVDLDIAVRILQPVVENACKFATSRASLSAERGQNGVLIRVDDDGPGVRPDEAETIFAPGVRGSAASAVADGPAAGRRRPEAGDPGGAGLGLSLSRRLARAAGGDVEAEAAASGGRFLVRLPAG